MTDQINMTAIVPCLNSSKIVMFSKHHTANDAIEIILDKFPNNIDENTRKFNIIVNFVN